MAQSKLATLLHLSEKRDSPKETLSYMQKLTPSQAADRSIERISVALKNLFEQRLPR